MSLGGRQTLAAGVEMWMRTAIGLMSGTSMDGVDAALLRTDGERIESLGPSLTLPYSDPFRARLRASLGKERIDDEARQIERELTDWHASAVDALISENSFDFKKVDVVGFHGQTVFHCPADRVTVQLGDGAALAAWLGIPVAWDFRTADVTAGGQGAPMVPLYHAALAGNLELPVAVLNVGGVANVTWVGGPDEILAFDTGPGNAPMDDWAGRHFGLSFDQEGRLARSGNADIARVSDVLNRAYFAKNPPKSLDRNEFTDKLAMGLSEIDGMSTLCEITARSIAAACDHFPRPVRFWIVCGGGRHNKWLMRRLEMLLEPATVTNSDALGWSGDAIEAQAFGYLAVRVMRGLPLSLPTTTGVPYPMPGGRVSQP